MTTMRFLVSIDDALADRLMASAADEKRAFLAFTFSGIPPSEYSSPVFYRILLKTINKVGYMLDCSATYRKGGVEHGLRAQPV
ncbi:unnamed protein product [Ranitomeya imitator]|uniref:Uncharacterized protein n=1 Tax=Ranitomeya imitator TaxID=111125 RepID=A0ABN9LNG3_9NEOB|nr:unnamed protein product [Ranitomeya imitator]